MVRLEVVIQAGNAILELDLIGNESIQLKKSASDVREIARRKGSFTQEFSLPFTPKNNQFFGFFEEYGQAPTAFKPSIKTVARIYEFGIPIISGILKYQKVDRVKKLHKVIVVDALVDLATVLGDDTLNELFEEYTELDHVLSRAQIIASWTTGLTNTAAAVTGAVRYPFADWGYNWRYDNNINNRTISEEKDAVTVEQFRPFVQVKWILQKLFLRAGFTFESAFFDSALFEDVYVSMTPKPEIEPTGITAGFEVNLDSTDQVISSGLATTVDFKAAVYDTQNSFDLTDDDFTIEATGRHEFEIFIKGQATNLTYLAANIFVDSGSGFVIAPNSGNDSVTWFDVNPIIGFSIASGAFSGTLRVTILFSGNAVEGDKIQLRIFQRSNAAANFEIESDETRYALISAPPQFDNSTIEMRYNSPTDVKQIDFLRAIFERFNIWAIPSKLSATILECEPFDDLFASGQTYDITSFIDQDESIILEPMSDFKNKRLLFQDNDSKNFINELYAALAKRRYGGKEVFIKDDFAQGEMNIFSVFEPPTQYKITGSELVCLTNYERNPDTGTPQPRAAQMMLAFLKSQPLNTNENFKFLSRIDNSYTNISSVLIARSFNQTPFNNNSFDLNFQLDTFFYQQLVRNRPLKPDVFTAYWENYLSQIYSDESKFAVLKANLSPSFINQFELKDKLIIQNTIWRVNSMSYLTGGKTTLELIKFIDVSGTLSPCALIPDTYNIDGTISFVNATTGSASTPTKVCCEAVGGTYVGGETPVCLWRTGRGQGDGGIRDIRQNEELRYQSNTIKLTLSEAALFWPSGLDFIALPEGTWQCELTIIGIDGGIHYWVYAATVVVTNGVHSGSLNIAFSSGGSSGYNKSINVNPSGIKIIASRAIGGTLTASIKANLIV